MGTIGTLALWSRALLVAGFVLQVTLLVLTVRRRLAGEVPVFTGLLLFYAARSMFLYVMMQRLSREVSDELYSGFAAADFVLQVALAGELLLRMGLPVRTRVLAAVAGLVSAGVVTAALAAWLPSRSPMPADRGVIFIGLLFTSLFAIGLWTRLAGWPRAVAAGLAMEGAAGALSECGKAVAAFHRDGHGYVAWSYGNAAVYLGALCYWTIAAMRHESKTKEADARTVRYAHGTI